jgi:hypothetical protein
MCVLAERKWWEFACENTQSASMGSAGARNCRIAPLEFTVGDKEGDAKEC